MAAGAKEALLLAPLLVLCILNVNPPRITSEYPTSRITLDNFWEKWISERVRQKMTCIHHILTGSSRAEPLTTRHASARITSSLDAP